MTRRINRNITQYLMIKVIIRKGHVEEEYELIPNADVSTLLAPNHLLEVQIMDFEFLSPSEKEFS